MYKKPNHFVMDLQRFLYFFVAVQSPGSEMKDVTPDSKTNQTKLVLKRPEEMEVSVAVHRVDEPSN